MEWIFIGIMIAIGLYIAQIVLGFISLTVVGILQILFGKN